ncbi:hypothetical protein F4553_006961 [Allocatelliglobosispora scoriae]|uniref:Endonuclease/exonuclease/phosphatase family protein n=1 Tax=Allocatelliglobosispora scoriae TaxID=643052 RepID=A0A841BWN5_9ACTN|nr:hypothetical protein [Allocatelliglobosispora scoriae]MBB5873527.1 hypothetical protein [Allocatelliglobosispora scoriae]
MIRHRFTAAVAAALALAMAPAASAQAAAPPEAAAVAADRVLRVYNNNIENLVRNNADGSCTRISGPDHLTSILVDDSGRTGTAGVVAPDILIVQQVRGTGQATAYADQLSAKFGYAAGTYRAIVAWDDPEEWGTTHKCSVQSLGDLKKKQTNGIIYNTRRLSLAAGDVSAYWSAGWLKPGTAYADGAGCTLYKPPSIDADADHKWTWKRTSAIAARFTVKETGTTVFAATMHLPQENRQNACAGDGDKGIASSGIHLGADATSLLNGSTIRIVGIDANRTGIAASTLSGYGMTGYGTGATNGSSKIDYLFIRGTVQPSSVAHTVSGTKSNHLALYGFINF